MGLWRKFRSMVGLENAVERTPGADPVQQATEDAYLLVAAMFTGEPWGRRAWTKRMGQPRWELATDLLRAMDIVDRKGRCLLPMGYSQPEAEILVREGAHRMRRRMGHKNFVSAR